MTDVFVDGGRDMDSSECTRDEMKESCAGNIQKVNGLGEQNKRM